jgi:hypothetical protein
LVYELRKKLRCSQSTWKSYILTKTYFLFCTLCRGAFFAAASFMSFQHCKFNFGAESFK